MSRRAVALALLLGLIGQVRSEPAGEDFFEKAIRPVLVERCVSCHGPTVKKAGLRLDTREAALAGGTDGPVIVPGKPAESRLIAAIKHVGEVKMPQDGKLSVAEVAAFEKWVTLGAPWPAKVVLHPPEKVAANGVDHWSFRPVKRPALPVSDAANPVDAFIRAKLTEKKLSPSPEADRRTLIRRLTFDLHGLPPTPEEVAAFQADQSPDAYGKVVDRLLASPRYGERWGRHWLDVARYADNKGYVFFEEKNYPWAWTYRDYVIGAFNRDVPFDRFVMEQIAADKLELEDKKSLAALGFLTVGGHFMGNTHDMIDDRIDTITRGLMGLTVSCARCHDHKFDPVPQADYYSLYGIFRSCTEPTIPPLWGTPPDTAEYKKFAAELVEKEKQLMDFVLGKHKELVTQARTRAGDYLLAAHAARNQPPADDFMLIADKGDLNPAMIARWRAFLETTRKRRDTTWAVWHRYADLPDAEFAAKATTIKHEEADNPLVRTAFAMPPKTMKDVADRYGKLLADAEKAWVAAGAKGPLPDPAAEALRSTLYGPTSPADAPLALDWGFLSLFPDRATQGEYQKLIKEVETHAAKGPPRAMVLLDGDRPFDPRVFIRGQPSRLGEPVPRQFLKVVDTQRQPYVKGSGRLELAKAVASKDNPLTARVFVNRVWMHHFGRGLVNTPGDFGLRGDPPTHPELLDWLASELMTNSWSVKKLHRQIVTSAAYRQSSQHREDGVAADPENRLLWKQNRRRLEFESLHDSLLAVSGSLDTTIGGPSVPLFAGKTRRAVYGYIDRLEFPSLLATFDVPNPAATSPERTSTTVAPQALYLMNGPFARDAARRLVNSPVIKGTKTPAEKLDALFLAAFSRKPTDTERTKLLAFVAKGSEAERWLDLSHGLLLTNEFAFVD
ncbi:PSD1 and planctomycete cytochrome C domain-containing protein [Zavarzinella formosa]|uniref:PSD1 and planctomycete cytochrome C domain-containing protein n=1 Tax=Zavarzinella formosa TaxID=360055 RepID=UPI0002E82B9F|nr:PSD1 and planctomycete cytochrome C domain-containing protein [Zavarzinella formosa]